MDIYVARTGHESNKVLLHALLQRVEELEKDMVLVRGRQGLPGAIEQIQIAQLTSAKAQGKRIESVNVEIGKLKTEVSSLQTSQTDTRARMTAGIAVLMAVLSVGLALARLLSG